MKNSGGRILRIICCFTKLSCSKEFSQCPNSRILLKISSGSSYFTQNASPIKASLTLFLKRIYLIFLNVLMLNLRYLLIHHCLLNCHHRIAGVIDILWHSRKKQCTRKKNILMKEFKESYVAFLSLFYLKKFRNVLIQGFTKNIIYFMQRTFSVKT